MIIDIFLSIIYAFFVAISYPLTFLPIASLSEEVNLGVDKAMFYLKPINSVIPVDTIFKIIAILMSIELAYFIYKGIMWVIKRIKG